MTGLWRNVPKRGLLWYARHSPSDKTAGIKSRKDDLGWRFCHAWQTRHAPDLGENTEENLYSLQW